MMDAFLTSFSFEMHARYRQEEALRQAAHARLLEAIRRARPRHAGPYERLVHWLGTQLVKWGYGLLPLRPPERSAPLPGLRPARPRHGVARADCRPAGPKLRHGNPLLND